MKNPFAIRRDERRPAFVALLLAALLQVVMMVYRYDLFTRGGNQGYWNLFFNHFQVSGFDPLTYITLSHWDVYYEIFRHPVLSLLWYPFALLNEWLMGVTGINCAIFIVAGVLTVCAVYSFLFLYRILHELIGVGRTDALLLVVLFFSFSHIMLTVMVPDHFGLSLFLLTLTLYVAGRKWTDGGQMKAWQTALLCLLTAGVTTTNGVKVWLADAFVNGRRSLSPLRLLVTVAFPVAILAGACLYQDAKYVQPRLEAGRQMEAYHMRKDTIQAAKIAQAKREKTAKKGIPLAEKGLLQWTDISTPRLPSAVENLFGESIQLHPTHTLQDLFHGRPVIVSYDSALNYAIESLLVALFLLGILCGLRFPLMQLCLSWFAFDMLLHVVLGFGLNEIYIMAAHWLFIFPIAFAFLLRPLNRPYRHLLRFLLLLLTLFLWGYNGYYMSTTLLSL